MFHVEIRKAEAADLPRLAPLAEQFYSSSDVLRTFDIEHFSALWRGFFESGIGVIFLLEQDGEIKGTIGGIAFKEAYSPDMLAQEFFWFVDPNSRGAGVKLYRAFEEWAKEKGCDEIRMVHLIDSMPEKVGAFYERIGYKKLEIHYGKRLR